MSSQIIPHRFSHSCFKTSHQCSCSSSIPSISSWIMNVQRIDSMSLISYSNIHSFYQSGCVIDRDSTHHLWNEWDYQTWDEMVSGHTLSLHSSNHLIFTNSFIIKRNEWDNHFQWNETMRVMIWVCFVRMDCFEWHWQTIEDIWEWVEGNEYLIKRSWHWDVT